MLTRLLKPDEAGALIGVSPKTLGEPHYTVKEIAEWWGFDPKVVRNIFREEKGVLVIGNPKSTYTKRSHTTLRIPKSVLDRVHSRIQVKA